MTKKKCAKNSQKPSTPQITPNIIIDGHYAAAVTPTDLVTNVFVLRRNPKELKEFMQKCGFSDAKLYENLSAEILDSCLVEAIQTQSGKVCELDVTGKTVEENVAEIMEVLEKRKTMLCGHCGLAWYAWNGKD